MLSLRFDSQALRGHRIEEMIYNEEEEAEVPDHAHEMELKERVSSSLEEKDAPGASRE